LTSSPITGDVIDRLAASASPHVAQAIRAHRPKIAESIQATYDAMFVDEPCAFDLRLRLSCAAKVATLTAEPALAAFYLDALERLGLSTGTRPAQALEKAVLDHASLVATQPALAGRAAIDTLLAAGLSDYDVVTLSQLIGYVAFQARVILAVRALSGIEREGVAGGARADVVRHHGFTAESIEWRSWLTPVDVAAASADQLAVLDESGPTARTSPYYLTLVHNPTVLRQRSATYNAIMYAPGGLARADRELGALVVSTLNGCPYCASVHAQRLNQLTKGSDLVARVFADPVAGGASAREAALLRYARRLTLDTLEFDVADVAHLRALDMSDGEILDLSHAVAIFAWANRLMQTLGEPVFPDARHNAEKGAEHA
jgi:uncharacterized peroxidase-related enzyme